MNNSKIEESKKKNPFVVKVNTPESMAKERSKGANSMSNVKKGIGAFQVLFGGALLVYGVSVSNMMSIVLGLACSLIGGHALKGKKE